MRNRAAICRAVVPGSGEAEVVLRAPWLPGRSDVARSHLVAQHLSSSEYDVAEWIQDEAQ